MKNYKRIFSIVALVVFMLIICTSCKKCNKNTGDAITFKETTQITDETVGSAYYVEVSNSQKSFTFSDYIEVEKKFSWTVSLDVEGIKIISSKVANLEEGMNYFYVQVKNDKSGDVKLYNFIVKRRFSYTVDFNTYTEHEIESLVVEENSYIKQPEDLETIGFTFAGWDYDFSKPITEDTIIDAQWIPNEYKVTLDSAGGTLENNEVAVNYSQPFELPTPEKEGYTFAGWYYENQKVTADIWLSLMDLTFVAKWTPVNYSISYENLKDVKNENPVKYNVETNTFVLKNPVHYLYTFAGWTYEGQTEPVLNVEITKGSTGDKTFTANWLDVQLVLKNNDEYEVACMISNNVESIVIPSEYNGKKITSIGDGAFKGCYNLKNITLPNTIKTIGVEAFSECSFSTIVIPNGVETIKDNAFNCCLELKSITLPNSVTTIGNRAFYRCEKLANITLPNNLETIGQEAFAYCELLENVVIPNSVASIGFGAFYYCENITTITLPFIGSKLDDSEITWIGYIFGAQNYKKNEDFLPYMLEKVIITKGTIIGDVAFYGCSQLTEIVIPNSVISIGQSAFYGCEYLTSIELPDSLTTIGAAAFAECTNLETILIPNNVTTIDQYAFQNCTNLKEVELSKGINTLPYGIFYGCENLEQLTIPNSVAKIESYAVANCTKLTEIIISKNVTEIEQAAFSNCENLTIYCKLSEKPNCWNDNWYQNIGEVSWDYIDVTETYVITFNSNGGNKLIDITFGYGNTNINLPQPKKDGYNFIGWFENDVLVESITEYKDYYLTAKWETIIYTITYENLNDVTNDNPTEYTIESDTIILIDLECPGYIFLGWTYEGQTEPIKNVEIKTGSTGDKSFTANWEKIKYSEGLEYELSYDEQYYMVYGIGECTDDIVKIPVTYNGLPVTGIESYAFYECQNLKGIIIPETISYIGYSVFLGCISLNNIEVDSNNEYYKSVDGNLYSKDGTVLIQYAVAKQNTSFDIPNEVNTIIECAFFSNFKLQKIVISENVNNIEAYAFEGSVGLVNIEVNSRNQHYKSKDGDLYSKDGKTLIQYAVGKQNTSFNIPNEVETIFDGAFAHAWNLSKITIPNNIKNIGANVFYECNNLEFNIYNSNYYLGNNTNPYLAFISVSDLSKSEYTINENTKTIANYAFYNCTNLTSIEIPDSVTNIGDYAFYDCSSLTSIEIPNSVTSIESSVFSGCTSLTSVVIGDSVTSIGRFAFLNCTSLENVYYNGTIEDWCKISFSDYDSNPMYYAEHIYMLNENNEYYEVKEIVIPETVTAIGSYQFYGFDNLISIEIPNSVTSIGDSAFYKCTSLTSVVIGDSVTSIGDNAFYYCTSLTSIIIPNNVISVGEIAFGYCFSLTIYCEANSKPSSWNEDWNYTYCPVVWGYSNN